MNSIMEKGQEQGQGKDSKEIDIPKTLLNYIFILIS
jgi:hypothetical protein